MIKQFVAERKVKEKRDRIKGVVCLLTSASLTACLLNDTFSIFSTHYLFFVVCVVLFFFLAGRGIFLIVPQYLHLENNLEVGDMVYLPDSTVFTEMNNTPLRFEITKFDLEHEKVLLKAPKCEIYREVLLDDLLARYRKI